MQARRLFSRWISFAYAAALAAGCQGTSGSQTASAEIEELGDSGVDGTVEFTQLSGGKIRVVADLSGLTPGQHGLHIHQYGDCSDPTGKSAGDHFNPDMVAHGGPGSQEHHAGDFGNISADESGRAYLTFETEDFTLDRGPRGIIGRSVIVHEKADDLMSQPSGDAGGRIGCGVIRAASGANEPVLPPEES